MKIPIFAGIAVTKNFFDKYERRISAAAIITGFIVDSLTLQRIDLFFENLVIISYLAVIGFGIVLLNTFERDGMAGGRIAGYARLFVPVVMQFAFGGLFSAFLVFYSRSASITASWPFLLIILALLVGNDFFRKKYTNFVFHTSIFFVAIFSFAVFSVPIVVGSIGAWVFLLSGAVSLGLIWVFAYGLSKIIPNRFYEKKRALTASIISIFVVMNFLYFTNIIPPIPLSLKEAGAYYFVERNDKGEYLVRSEKPRWYDFLKIRETFHVTSGQPLYFLSSVFAPTRLETTILHCWEYFNEDRDKWTSTGCVRFPIAGGRDGGYRGYSVKENITPGLWRVDVETTRGQLIGRKKFRVKAVEEAPSFRVEAI